ncbi:MAG: hypothetical protein ACP5RW_10305, partial [bacterium]
MNENIVALTILNQPAKDYQLKAVVHMFTGDLYIVGNFKENYINVTKKLNIQSFTNISATNNIRTAYLSYIPKLNKLQVLDALPNTLDDNILYMQILVYNNQI